MCNTVYTEETQTNTYMYLYKTANINLEELENLESGKFYKILTCIIFSSFTIEAYMNHIGYYNFNFWTEVEKKRPLEKLKILYSVLELNFDKSLRPIQSIIEMFKYRNLLAHGKTETNTNRINHRATEVKMSQIVGFYQTRWEAMTTAENARRYFDDMKEVITLLNNQIESEISDPFLVFSSSAGNGSPLTNERSNQ